MKLLTDQTAIVLLGHWNRMIFTPGWVCEHLFGRITEVDTLVPLLPVEPLLYTHNDIKFFVQNTRLVFQQAKEATTESLLYAESLAVKVLTKLPDTPLRAVGINFDYEASPTVEGSGGLFPVSDLHQLGKQGWEKTEEKVVRQVKKDGQILNLTITSAGKKLTALFNFHTDASEKSKALEAVSGRVLVLREASRIILQEVYQWR